MDIFGRIGMLPGQWNRGLHGKGLAYDREIARRRAGGRTTRVVVTGHEEIDAKLAALDSALQKKLTRKALRNGANYVKKQTQEIIENDTDGEGAYAASIKTRAMKRSRVRIGYSVLPERKKFFAEYEERYGKQPNPSPKYHASDPFYVPAALEFGWTSQDGTYHQPVRAQRRGLYDSEDVVLGMFRADMRELVNEAGK